VIHEKDIDCIIPSNQHFFLLPGSQKILRLATERMCAGAGEIYGNLQSNRQRCVAQGFLPGHEKVADDRAVQRQKRQNKERHVLLLLFQWQDRKTGEMC